MLGAALNGAGQVIQHPATQSAVELAMMAFVPEATGLKRLYRFAKGAETATRLSRQAEQAEANGLPHGISVSSNPRRFPGREAEAGPGATQNEIEKTFEVRQTGNDPAHHTVILPKPVTDAVAQAINRLFRP
jgi:hypothetical protein